MKVALVHPPTCDPTAPYVAVPLLAAWLRQHGIEVLAIDANIEAWDALLRRGPLLSMGERVRRKAAALDALPSLDHEQQLLYAQVLPALGDAAAAPEAIGQAIETLRGERFYDSRACARAVGAVHSAQRLVAAPCAPLDLDFLSYRTPFSLLSAEEIERDASPERDPFHSCFAALCDRLAAERVGVLGLSVAFPGQVQPAFSLAHLARRRLPGVHVTAGGPALTQILARLDGDLLARALGPLHSAVLFEGEDALLDLVRAVDAGRPPRGVVRGGTRPLGDLPAPDFSGLPLRSYLAPEVVLPYDLTRGCWWGRCAFCHYGLATEGTASYRERDLGTAISQIDDLASRHGCRVFYLSHDSVAPKTLLALARAHSDGTATGRRCWRWATDLRPDRYLTEDRCRELAEGGGLAVALGVESGSPRVLRLIDKGVGTEDVAAAIRRLAAAGFAVEAMTFSGFPSETSAEARQTIGFLREHRQQIALFVVGEFGLTHGSRVAADPGAFGIGEIWSAGGDELGTGIFWRPARPEPTDRQAAAVDRELDALCRGHLLRPYPWAGALSTAHTLLYYARFGPSVFRDRAGQPAETPPPGSVRHAARFDLEEVAEESALREAAIWHELTHVGRRVSRADYRELAGRAPHAAPSPSTWRIAAGREPRRERDTSERRGRRR